MLRHVATGTSPVMKQADRGDAATFTCVYHVYDGNDNIPGQIPRNWPGHHWDSRKTFPTQFSCFRQQRTSGSSHIKMQVIINRVSRLRARSYNFGT